MDDETPDVAEVLAEPDAESSAGAAAAEPEPVATVQEVTLTPEQWEWVQRAFETSNALALAGVLFAVATIGVLLARIISEGWR